MIIGSISSFSKIETKLMFSFWLEVSTGGVVAKNRQMGENGCSDIIDKLNALSLY